MVAPHHQAADVIVQRPLATSTGKVMPNSDFHSIKAFVTEPGFSLVPGRKKCNEIRDCPLPGDFGFCSMHPVWDRAIRRVKSQLGVLERARSRFFLFPPFSGTPTQTLTM
jgi:hypothetical protein